MDFLEGFLMGPVWSDTEYETRRHIGFYWLIGWVFAALFTYTVLFPDKVPGIFNLPTALPWLFFFLLALASPFACNVYYRLNLAVRIGILLLEAVKFAFGFLGFWQFWDARVTVDMTAMPQQVMEYINTVIAQATDYFSGLGDGTSMLVGIIAGGVVIVLTFAGILLLATALPAVFLVVMKLIQRGLDKLACLLFIKEND